MPILQEHKEFLLSQSESKTLLEWYQFFDYKYSKNQIYSFCYRNNKKIKKLDKNIKSQIQSENARKYNINQDYFKTWSNNMAYILGFWYADGCIYGGKMFDITLHKKDKYIIKKIAQELDYQGPILDYVDRQACRINFSCKVSLFTGSSTFSISSKCSVSNIDTSISEISISTFCLVPQSGQITSCS